LAGKIQGSGAQGCAQAEITIQKEPGTEYKRILALSGGGVRARSATKAVENRGTLRITITAKDIVALRASMNAVMRDLQVIAAVGHAGKPRASIPQKRR
jgi:tRNA threonylcarbamoyladenosine modification (KEOPS) complex  Pcc1 subunit